MPTVQVAAFAAVVTCTLYFLISGMEVATQRSYVMALIGFGAKLFDRPAISLRSLAVALTAVTGLQPESVVTPGFQMSFAASAALIALYEMWPQAGRAETPGVIRGALAWVIGAAATSLVASTATMPFALHHFERAALFSILANLAATPVISFWTTPAAAAAALAAPLGLDHFFFAMMGKSLEVVTWIAQASADLSPDFDLQRLSALGMGLSALAIALFCVFRGRGRLVAAIPAAAMMWVWLSAPQTVGYVAADSSVFLKDGKTWLELADWRGKNGMDPLAVGDDTARAPCMGKGAPCHLELASGAFDVVSAPSAAPYDKTAPCPTEAVLRYAPKGKPSLEIKPCSYPRGGAVIELGRTGAGISAAPPESGRPWTPR